MFKRPEKKVLQLFTKKPLEVARTATLNGWGLFSWREGWKPYKDCDYVAALISGVDNQLWSSVIRREPYQATHLTVASDQIWSWHLGWQPYQTGDHTAPSLRVVTHRFVYDTNRWYCQAEMPIEPALYIRGEGVQGCDPWKEYNPVTGLMFDLDNWLTI